MAPAQITEDYYAILEVEQSASSDVIARSYKRLALKLHPDRNLKLDTTEAFQRVCQFINSSHFMLVNFSFPLI